MTLKTRYGVEITEIDNAHSYVETADRIGYGAPMKPSTNMPTVKANADTPAFPEDGSQTSAKFAITFAHACATVHQDTDYVWLTESDGPYHYPTVTYVESEGTFWQHSTESHVPAEKVSSLSWSLAGGLHCGSSFGGYGGCIAPLGHTGRHLDATGHRFDVPEANVIELRDATEYERKTYGILYRSANVHGITGAKHNHGGSFLVTVWSNTNRPNPNSDDTAHKFIDPRGKATADPIGVTTAAQVGVISRHPDPNRLTQGRTLEIGQRVELLLPTGEKFGPFEITQNPLSDPHLVPIK